MILKVKGFSILFLMTLFLSCESELELKEEDKIFHAGPNMSGIGATFFELYKNNIYNFCDGDFLDYGCYKGKYELNNNILTLSGLKLNDHVKNNRFIIYKYADQDSIYWKRKYPNSSLGWRKLKQSDIKSGSEGDIYELDNNDKPRIMAPYYYVIRMDKLK